jgi:hypothetical protein
VQYTGIIDEHLAVRNRVGLFDVSHMGEVFLRGPRALEAIRHLVTKGGEDLFRRSDQYSFHQIGLPVLFFFEGLPISRNVDYHTWRDRIEGVSIRKITRSARLVRNAIWLLASDDRRPPAPGR